MTKVAINKNYIRRILLSVKEVALTCMLFFVITYTLNSCTSLTTPKEFLNNVAIEKQTYRTDSLLIMRQLYQSLKKHEDFFYSKEFYDYTELVIDTIIYNRELSKVAVLVITKNPTSRQLMPNNTAKWYYNGTCYIGVRKKDAFNLGWQGPSFTNSIDRIDLSKDMREVYFTQLAGLSSTRKKLYNINDIRFWNLPIWTKIMK